MVNLRPAWDSADTVSTIVSSGNGPWAASVNLKNRHIKATTMEVIAWVAVGLIAE